MANKKELINQSPTGDSTGGGYINVYFVEVEKGRWEYSFGQNKDVPQHKIDEFINRIEHAIDVLNES